jgi:hypothetical protein
MCWVGNSGFWRVWDKTGRRRRFGYLGGGKLETTDLGSGIGAHASVYPYFYDFRSLGVRDISLPRSETEWINLSIGLSYTPPRRAWG